MHILVVEDDKTLAMGIEYSLKQEGYETSLCYTAQAARDAIESRRFSLVILDVALPDGNGFELCQSIRGKGDTPVIFLTARDDEATVVMGLDLGADDYITKPFRVRELLSRIKSVLRRYHLAPAPQGRIHIGSLVIDTSEARVFKEGQPVALTAMEYRLLLTLAQNAGRVLTRNQILEEIWDVGRDFVNDNTLTVYIKRLREKIEEDPRQPQIIMTVRGLGYKVGEPSETSQQP